MRGFSGLVREALDAYLRDVDDDEIDRLLNLEGILDDEQDAELRARVEAVREQWRVA
jgi:hypothetical protein